MAKMAVIPHQPRASPVVAIPASPSEPPAEAIRASPSESPAEAIRASPSESPAVAIRASLSESLPAVPDVIPRLRHAAAELAQAVGVEETRLDDVRLAVSEAVSNVVLHAYAGKPGNVQLTARVVEEELWILVTDDGRGHNASPVRAGLGWGLAFITDAADEFALVERAEGGTEARMVFRLPPAAG